MEPFFERTKALLLLKKHSPGSQPSSRGFVLKQTATIIFISSDHWSIYPATPSFCLGACRCNCSIALLLLLLLCVGAFLTARHAPTSCLICLYYVRLEALNQNHLHSSQWRRHRLVLAAVESATNQSVIRLVVNPPIWYIPYGSSTPVQACTHTLSLSHTHTHTHTHTGACVCTLAGYVCIRDQISLTNRTPKERFFLRRIAWIAVPEES